MSDVKDRRGLVREAVDWESYDLIIDFEPPNPRLIVRGETPYPMEIVIEPAPEVVALPEYWPTFVVGYRDEIVTEVVTPFEVSIGLGKLSSGTKGIELIGKTKHQNIDLPGAAVAEPGAARKAER